MTTATANVSTLRPVPRTLPPRIIPSCPGNQWLAERKKLLAREKELTRLGDQVARRAPRAAVGAPGARTMSSTRRPAAGSWPTCSTATTSS